MKTSFGNSFVFSASNNLRRTLHCAFIILATLVVYQGVRHNQFVWDTVPFVLENPWVHHPGAGDFLAMFTRKFQANWQPMVWLSHALDFALFGEHAAWHHLSNVVYHTVNACLVYLLGARLLVASGFAQRQREAAALVSALVFALHPQHVQSVAWLVERKDTLYSLFTLLCYILWLKAWQDARPGNRWLALLCAVLALMSKPMAVTIPVILLLLDIYPLRRWQGDFHSFIRLVAEKWPFWLLATAVVGVTLYTQQMAMVSSVSLPPWARLLTAVNNTGFYIQGYLWPTDLAPFYPYPTTTASILAPGYWLPGLMLLLASFVTGGWLWIRGYRWPLLMIVFYYVTLLPVSGVIAVGPAKALNYYSYLATLPVGFALSLSPVYLYRISVPVGRSAAIGLGAWLLWLALLSVQQVQLWRNELVLWNWAWHRFPDAAYVNRNLAAAWLANGDYHRALEHARQSALTSAAGRDYYQQLKKALQDKGVTVAPVNEQ